MFLVPIAALNELGSGWLNFSSVCLHTEGHCCEGGGLWRVKRISELSRRWSDQPDALVESIDMVFLNPAKPFLTEWCKRLFILLKLSCFENDRLCMLKRQLPLLLDLPFGSCELVRVWANSTIHIMWSNGKDGLVNDLGSIIKLCGSPVFYYCQCNAVFV